MCIEPAAAAALPVWERFVSSSAPCMVQAILGAVAGLTAFEYFAPLADAAVRTHLAQGGTWGTVCGRWRACVWADPSPLCARARLHAAYAAHAHAHCDAHHLRAAFLALVATDIDL
ncbi:unnamed protein product [Diatraea saccharalis]|uniref:Uncharacterized protein n=1 Tax=Diatraea saccharalis TaxID=40085 RepID=A0A9N9R0I5_9NEOP|nr:unnamed protein product [Diatraea saccharalis]